MNFILRIVFALLLLSGPALATVAERDLATASEQQHYRISYRGVFTAYIWKDLADMGLYTFAESEPFNGVPVCRLSMTIDTRNYGFAEFSYPVRLRYDALHAADLSRTYLVSDHDEGVENVHNIYWFDWTEKSLRSYRKRQYLLVNPHKVGSSFFWEKDEYAWEQSGEESLPEFLQDYPRVGDDLSYLIHAKTTAISEPAGVDVLTMLYALRAYDYAQSLPDPLAVIHKNKLGYYQLKLMGKESVQLAGQRQQALHVRIKKEDNRPGSMGQLDVWLSDDEQHHILRLEVAARVGLIRVEMTGRQGGAMPGGCAATKNAQQRVEP